MLSLNDEKGSQAPIKGKSIPQHLVQKPATAWVHVRVKKEARRLQTRKRALARCHLSYHQDPGLSRFCHCKK